MEALRVLAHEIGPRPACSEAEERAADWCAERLRQQGLDVVVETFPSRRSATPWLCSYLGLAAAGAFLLAPVPLVAFVLSAAALVLYARDVDGRPLVLPKGHTSTNVVARRSPATDPALVVVAELDSGRASPRFSPRFPPGPRRWAVAVHAALIALPTASATAWVAESAGPLPATLWIFGLALGVLLVGAIWAELHADAKLPLLHGANDNASGVEAIMQLTKRFSGPEVWWVLLGSGHSGEIGMQSFLETHASRLGHARLLGVRGLGGGVLDAPADEGLLRLRRADPALLDAAVEAGAATTRLRAVQSAAAVALANGRRAATMAGVDDRGAIAGQGRPGDELEAIDAPALAHAIDVVARVVEVVTGVADAARARPPLADGHGST